MHWTVAVEIVWFKVLNKSPGARLMCANASQADVTLPLMTLQKAVLATWNIK